LTEHDSDADTFYEGGVSLYQPHVVISTSTLYIQLTFQLHIPILITEELKQNIHISHLWVSLF